MAKRRRKRLPRRFLKRSAAPRRRRRRLGRRSAPHRRRRTALVRRNPTSLMVANPRRGRGGRRRRSLARRGRFHVVRRGRRRRNPVMSMRGIGYLVKVGVAGGLGIIAVRIGKFLYVKYLEDKVLGAEGRADPKSWRAILNEVLQLVVMGAVAWGVGRAMRKIKPEYATAFMVGGLAETGRQAIGKVVEKVSPTTDRNRWGLGEIPAGYEDENGNVYVLDSGGNYVLAQRGMGELVDEEAFSGLVEEDQFDAAEVG